MLAPYGSRAAAVQRCNAAALRYIILLYHTMEPACSIRQTTSHRGLGIINIQQVLFHICDVLA
jgi:hypothetical protein